MSAVAGVAPARAAGRRWLGFALAFAALTIWAGWFAVTRLSLTRELGAYDIAALRLGVGALGLLPAFLRSARGLPRAAWREGVVLSVGWGAPFVLLLSWGIGLTSAGYAAAITPSAMPVFAGVIGWAVLGERPGRLRCAGFALICVGIATLCVTRHTSARLWETGAGTAAALGASALWAIYTLRVRRSGLTPLQAAALVCLYSAAAYLPFYALSGASRLGRAPWAEIVLQAFYQGVLVSGVAVIAFNRAVALIGPGTAGSVTALVPVAAILLGIPILGEWPTPLTAVAVAAIVVGVLLAVRTPGAA